MSKFFLERHSRMRAARKKRSSMKERIEAPRMRPSQPPILAEIGTNDVKPTVSFFKAS